MKLKPAITPLRRHTAYCSILCYTLTQERSWCKQRGGGEFASSHATWMVETDLHVLNVAAYSTYWNARRQLITCVLSRSLRVSSYGWRSNKYTKSIPNIIWSRSSSVNIVSGYGLDHRAIEVRGPTEARGFFLSPVCPDRLWGPPSLLSNGYRGPFLGGKVRPGRDADHSTPSTAQVVKSTSCTSSPQK
jgi:hypothetical protein